MKFQVFFDVASVELFADDGLVALTDIFFPNEAFNRIKLYAEDGEVQLDNGDIYELRSIW